MKLPDIKDNKFLDAIRHQTGYYPFSSNYNSEKNKKLYDQAKLTNVSQDVLNLIGLGDYFYKNFHVKLINQLNLLNNTISISTSDLIEIIVAYLNEQELLAKKSEEEFLSKNSQISAFDIQNGAFLYEKFPNNPRNFRSISETIVEFGNLLLRYLFTRKANQSTNSITNLSEEVFFKSLDQLFKICKKYYAIKNHYDGCLFYNGKIDLVNDEKIYFDCCTNDIKLFEQVSTTIILNQSLNAHFFYEYIAKQNNGFKEMILQHASSRILSKSIINKGYVGYQLRKRLLDDYETDVEYFAILKDYYPFYSSTKLINLKNLTITDLLRLHSELNNLIRELYLKDFPVENMNEINMFKLNFLPKIKFSVLRSYLVSVTDFSESRVESFMDLLTAKNSGRLNLYETPLLKKDNYYFFPYLPLVKRNLLFLVDYWLEQAQESLEQRGKDFEKYVKEQLQSVSSNGHNNFHIIPEVNFRVDNSKKEEIDLVIETKNTLIVGEIKCVKYPMYERDSCRILNDVIPKAISQLKRKSLFLTEHKEHFKKIYSIEGKKIIKVIILNFPVFTGAEIDGIPVIDANLFLAYFKSEKMGSISIGNDDIEELEAIPYYTTEEEFCNNFETYLKSPPLVRMYLDQLKISDCSYKLDDLPEIHFRDINRVNEEALLVKK